MFTATEFRLIHDTCPRDLTMLLNKLGIAPPNWDTGDEFKNTATLDNKITEKLSLLMKSDSVVGGYMNLLTLGKVSFDYHETDSALLEKVVNHRDIIIRSVIQPQAKAQANSTVSVAANLPRRTENPRRQSQLSPIPAIAGAVIIAVGIGILAAGRTAAGIAALFIGGAGVAIGLKGPQQGRKVVVAPPKRHRPAAPATSPPTTVPFTLEEIKTLLAVLAQANKIIKSIQKTA